MQKNILPDFLTVKEISEKTLVDRDVIRRHIRLKRLKTFQFNDRGPHLIDKKEYEYWLNNIAKVTEVAEKKPIDSNQLDRIENMLKTILSDLDKLKS